MYPNQGGYGQPQYPPQFPPEGFGSAMPQQPGMPMPQPFGAGVGFNAMPPQQPSFPGYPANNPYQSPPMPSNIGYPPMPSQQQPPNPMYPSMPTQQYSPQNQQYLPQQPQQGGMYPQMPGYGNPMGSTAPPQSGYPPQGQGYGQQNYGMPPQQEAPIHQQFASHAHSQVPTSNPIKKGRPTVVPQPNFDASNDAAALRKAMKGFGTDENAIINVLCRRPCAQRMEIMRAYKTAYGKDLISDIKSETSGNFENLLVSLLTNTIEYYCNEIYAAVSGAGTDEDVLIEVMCTMSNAEIRLIGATFYRMFGQSLEQVLRDDTSGSVKRLMTSLSVGGRDESMVTNVESARADAQALQKAGVGRWGTDESEFNRILCLRNYEQLKLICQEYQKLTGNSLEKDIKKEFSGDIEDALLAILRVANNRPEFFARRLHKSMAGIGTNDRSLIRLVVTRSEIDMMDVKEEFQRYYSKSLKSFIKGDTSGHYKHALYALIGENRSD